MYFCQSGQLKFHSHSISLSRIRPVWRVASVSLDEAGGMGSKSRNYAPSTFSSEPHASVST